MGSFFQRTLGFIRAIAGRKLHLQFLRAIPLFTFTHDSCVKSTICQYVPYLLEIPSWYFLVGIGQYFSINTIPILKENLVGTFSIVDTKKYIFTVCKGDDDGSEDDDGIDRSNGGADDGSEDDNEIDCLNGGAKIFGGVGTMMMMPTTNDAAASASIASFATAWTTRPPSTTPPPTAATTRTIGGGGDAVVTDEEYNYLALMAYDGLLRVGGRPVDVDKRGCGRGRRADAVAAAAATMIDMQWVVERRPPPSSIPPPRTGRRRRATTVVVGAAATMTRRRRWPWGGDDNHEARIRRRRWRVVRAILSHSFCSCVPRRSSTSSSSSSSSSYSP